MSEVFNVSANPHVRSKDTTQTIMRDVLIALTPASIFIISGLVHLSALLLVLRHVWPAKLYMSILCIKKLRFQI